MPILTIQRLRLSNPPLPRSDDRQLRTAFVAACVPAQRSSLWGSSALCRRPRSAFHAPPCNSNRGYIVCAASSTRSEAAVLVDDLLQRVQDTDSGQDVTSESRASIDAIIRELMKLGATQRPMEDPLLYGRYCVAYTSSKDNSPPAGGLFRGRIGRLLFRTRGLFQHVFKPNTVVNMVCFRVLGIVKGSVNLRGKLSPLDDEKLGQGAISVEFERPRLCFGNAVFQFGPRTNVRLATKYLDERVRVAVGGRGSLFVFSRGGPADSEMGKEWEFVFQAKPLPTFLLPALAVLALGFGFLAPTPARIGVLLVVLMFGFVLARGGTRRGDPGVQQDD